MTDGHVAPFLRQQAIAVNRVVRPEDSVSNVSFASWTPVADHVEFDDLDLPPPDLELPHVIDLDNKVKVDQPKAAEPQSVPSVAQAQPAEPPPGQDPVPKSAPAASSVKMADQQPAAPAMAPPPMVSKAAPATQAAQNLLAGTNPQYGSRKLQKQAARAAKKGARGLRFGQLGGLHNALSSVLPPYLSQVGSGSGERSVLVVDTRDQRISSPFQGWLLDEILINAQAGVNVLSDARQVRSPSTGYHMNLFYMRTLEGKKLIIIGSMTSYGSVPCGRWDSYTGEVLAHKAFQPFRWPIMRDDSATWVDLKVKIEGALLLHLELRGYRSDQDMTVQLNYINDAIVMALDEVLFIPSCTVVIFQGWRVCAVSFEVGGQLYACGEGGAVLALDFLLCHFEIRLTAVSSADACGTLAVPATWLVVSRVSGPTLVKNARWCRDHYARVEGPDQVMQLSQIAGIHAHWTAGVTADSIEDTGPRIGAVDVSSHVDNLHLTCESPLFKAEKKIVAKEAIALQYHDPATEKAAMILPPSTGTPGVAVAQSKWEAVRDLAGPRDSSAVVVGSARAGGMSLTTPGQAASSMDPNAQLLYAPRRSLEQRRGEQLADAAVTPQFFVEQARAVMSALPSQGAPRVQRPSTVTITPANAEPGAPTSFGPAAEEVITDV